MTTDIPTREQLNTEQRRAVDLALQGHNVFITGSGGTGKSFCLAHLVQALRLKGKRVEVTATTGIAAVNVGGVTVHSFAGFGIGNESRDELRRKAVTNKLKEIFTHVDTLVIDEISMCVPDYWEKLSLVAQTARQDNAPFGGVQIIAVGDFFQLPPVQRTSPETFRSRETKVADDKPLLCCETAVWRETFKAQHTVELKTIFRQTDPQFVECLQRIRWGTLTLEDQRLLMGRLHATVEQCGVRPTFLFSRMDDVTRMNQEHLDSLTTPAQIYHMVEGFLAPSGEASESLPPRNQRDKAVYELKRNVPAEEKLTLKVGAQVVLLTNLSAEHRLINGSRGTILRFTSTQPVYPVVRFLNGAGGRPLDVTIRAYMWKKVFRTGVYSYVAQIPLRLAYALTIHRSQSQSLDLVQLQMDKSIFEYNQAYTALSRVRTLKGLTLSACDFSCIRAHPRALAFYTSLGQNPLQKIMSQLSIPPPTLAQEDKSNGASEEEEDEEEENEEEECEEREEEEEEPEEADAMEVDEEEEDPDRLVIPRRKARLLTDSP